MYTLLAPGPVNLHPQVREALSLPMIHHRTPQFDGILQSVLKRLKLVFQTEQPVYIHSSTGSGGMESLLVNTLSPGDSVVAIISGKFGERWAEMAESFGLHVNRYQVPWGESADPADLKKQIDSKTKAVLCQACETSTGAMHPLQELAKVVSEFSECLFLVDGITAVGAYNIPMDAWKIDGLVAGSQKAFMLPTGLSFVSFSAKAQSFFKTSKLPKYYFDIRKEAQANANKETFFSSSVALIRALDVALNLIFTEGLENLWKQILFRAQMTRALADHLSLTVYAKTPSPSLTALQLPKGIDGQKLRLELESQYHVTVMGGQDQAKGKIIRIGHMGYITAQDMKQLFQALQSALEKHGHKAMNKTSFEKELEQWLSRWQASS